MILKTGALSFQPFFTIAYCSVCDILYVDKMLFTSSLNAFSSLCLSSASQLKVGCFMAGLPILGPAVLCGFSVEATTIACIGALVASAITLAIASLSIACSLAFLLFYFVMFA